MANPNTQEAWTRRISANQRVPYWGRRQFLYLLPMVRPQYASAEALPPPSSPVILVVKGRINRTNVNDETHLDRQLLEGFGTATLTTWTPWTDGDIQFVGVLLRTLLTELQASGSIIRAHALNDYFVDIPVPDAQQYDVLIAMSGADLDFSRRGKGPLWLIYPWSQHPELDNRVTSHKSIWQLSEMRVYE